MTSSELWALTEIPFRNPPCDYTLDGLDFEHSAYPPVQKL